MVVVVVMTVVVVVVVVVVVEEGEEVVLEVPWMFALLSASGACNGFYFVKTSALQYTVYSIQYTYTYSYT